MKSAAAVLVTILTVAVAATPASADYRVGLASDPADMPNGYYDVAGVGVRVDNGNGALFVDVTLHKPLPAQPAQGDYIALNLGSSAASGSRCSSDQKGDTYVSFRLGESPRVANVKVNVLGRGAEEYRHHPFNVSEDGRTVSLAITDERLVGSDLRCVDGSAHDTGARSGQGTDVVDGSTVLPDPATVAPCADASLKMDGPPSRVAFGRDVDLSVRVPSDRYAGSGRVEMRREAEQDPFFAEAFTAEEEKNLDEDHWYTLRVNDGDSAVLVTFSAVLFAEERGSACGARVVRRVTPVRGRAPRISTSRDGDRAVLRIREDADSCAQVAMGSVRVALRGPGARSTFTLRDPCGKWRGNGGKRGALRVRVTDARATRGAAISFAAIRSSTSRVSYRVTAAFRGRRVKSRTLVADVVHRRLRRVYSQTSGGQIIDEYWNYCVNNAQEVYFSGGRPYCLRGGTTRRRAFWR